MAFHSRVVEGDVEPSVLSLQERALGVPITGRNFREILVRHDQQDKIFWCFMNQTGRPSYTYSLGAEIQQVQDWIGNNYAMPANGGPDDLRYFVCGSKTPGIYNLGGDLRHFADCIRTRDLAAMRKLRRNMRANAICQHANSFGAPIITMALVQGDALGGGFEHALAFDILVAERSARTGACRRLYSICFPGHGRI